MGRPYAKPMLTDLEKAYIAGFLDGDGCVMFQLVRRKDYIYGYQIRASIVFYQKTNNRVILDWLKSKLSRGYIRQRNDDMTEYTIVGKDYVVETLHMLFPFYDLKRNMRALLFRSHESGQSDLTKKVCWH